MIICLLLCSFLSLSSFPSFLNICNHDTTNIYCLNLFFFCFFFLLFLTELSPMKTNHINSNRNWIHPNINYFMYSIDIRLRCIDLVLKLVVLFRFEMPIAMWCWWCFPFSCQIIFRICCRACFCVYRFSVHYQVHVPLLFITIESDWILFCILKHNE